MQRYGANDPVKGMGYSSNGGDTWVDVPVDHLFVGDEIGPRSFSGLRSTPGGWLVVAHRTLKDQPEVPGVERQSDEPAQFTVTVDGYVLEGRAPFGPAELRDPTGQIVRSWEQLEVGNPLWSGLEVVAGDVIIREEEGSGSITVTAEQWSALTDPLGPNRSELLFSPDGLQWSILDSSASWTQVLAATSDGVLVQRFSIGSHSQTVRHLELLPLPVATAE